LAAISLSASLWAVINWLISPIFWSLTHLPILCDMLGISSLIITAWWVRKPGSITFVGMIATLLNFILRPGANQFLGFTAASVFFDITLSLLNYNRILEGGMKGNAVLTVLSGFATFLAGYIIGNMFLAPQVLANVYGNVLFFAAVHMFGGLAGAIIGIVLIRGLESRGVVPQ
jgi:hypothetical protein